jgi:NitT/TauT family transport system permease protein
MRHVWPSALSWMFSSLHTSVGLRSGRGGGRISWRRRWARYLIQQAEGVFDVAGVFAGMFVLAAFVIVIDTIVSLIEASTGMAAGGRRWRA